MQRHSTAVCTPVHPARTTFPSWMRPRTQFIFVTHNANIPVQGDADGKIQTSAGGVDAPPVQQHIVSVMEGGKPSSGTGKFRAHGSVKPDSIMLDEHAEKADPNFMVEHEDVVADEGRFNL